MRRAGPLLITLLVVASVAIVPGVAVADDKYPDSQCNEAPLIEPNGDYEVVMNSPQDTDIMRIRLEKGNYIYFSTIIPNNQDNLQISYVWAASSVQEVSNVENNQGQLQEFVPDTQASWQLWAEATGTDVYCMLINDPGDGDVPYRFTLKMRLNSPQPASFESAESQSTLEQKNQRITELKNTLEQKNQRIQELQAKLNSSNGEVTIQVTVNPANGQQTFVEGGKAVVQAESENADVSNMRVEYGGNTYQLDSSDQVAIPLAEPGTQEMTLVYGDTTKQVSIEVQAQEGQNQQDANPTSTSAPGFGIVAALVALLSSAFLLQRHRQS